MFLGLPGPDESEGYDRPRLGLPDNQVALLEAVAAVNPRVVVVLANGSAVAVSGWQRPRAGDPRDLARRPGGRLAPSPTCCSARATRRASSPRRSRTASRTPRRSATSPASSGHVRYGEGVLVGYRWYDARDDGRRLPVRARPVVHDVRVLPTSTRDRRRAVDVASRSPTPAPSPAPRSCRSTSATREASVLRPTRELKALRQGALAPGESRDADVRAHSRACPTGTPGCTGGSSRAASSSSRSARRRATSAGRCRVEVEGDPMWGQLTPMSTIGEWFAHPVGGPLLQRRADAARRHAARWTRRPRRCSRRCRPRCW